MRRSFFVVSTYGFFVLRGFGRALSRKSVDRARLCENYQLFRSRSLARTIVNAAVRRTPLPTQNGTPFGVPSGGQRWRPHRFGRSQRRKLFTLFCRTAAACSYDPPKRRFGEHLCPRKTAPPLGRRLVGRGGFEPPKSVTSDLQSDPFGRSGICPHGGAAAKSLWSR